MEISEIDIRKYLPHRYPFLLVDKVLQVSSDEVTATKNVSYNEPFFVGHFPNEPIMPGVLIIEALAQASALQAFISNEKTPDDGYNVYLAGVEKSRFRNPVRPGDVLTLRAKAGSMKQFMKRFECEAYVGESLVCSARLTTIFRKQND